MNNRKRKEVILSAVANVCLLEKTKASAKLMLGRYVQYKMFCFKTHFDVFDQRSSVLMELKKSNKEKLFREICKPALVEVVKKRNKKGEAISTYINLLPVPAGEQPIVLLSESAFSGLIVKCNKSLWSQFADNNSKTSFISLTSDSKNIILSREASKNCLEKTV